MKNNYKYFYIWYRNLNSNIIVTFKTCSQELFIAELDNLQNSNFRELVDYQILKSYTEKVKRKC